jgi:hypothetical protein
MHVALSQVRKGRPAPSRAAPARLLVRSHPRNAMLSLKVSGAFLEKNCVARGRSRTFFLAARAMLVSARLEGLLNGRRTRKSQRKRGPSRNGRRRARVCELAVGRAGRRTEARRATSASRFTAATPEQHRRAPFAPTRDTTAAAGTRPFPPAAAEHAALAAERALEHTEHSSPATEYAASGSDCERNHVRRSVGE